MKKTSSSAKPDIRKLLKQKRADFIIKMIQTTEENSLSNPNLVYTNMQNHLFYLLKELIVGYDFFHKSINDSIKIGIFAPFYDEIDIFSLLYSTKQIKSKFPNNKTLKEFDNKEKLIDILDSTTKSEIRQLNTDSSIYDSIIFNSNVLNLENSFFDVINKDDDLRMFIKSWKNDFIKFYLPRVNNDSKILSFVENKFDFEIGKYGILEPKVNEDNLVNNEIVIPDIVITPLLGLEPTSMKRVGFGKGYFDYTLNHFKDKCGKVPIVIGITYESCIVDENIEFDDNDYPLDYAITEKTGFHRLI